jgi:hypothetical protein
MANKNQITLDNLTSALKTVYGQNTEPVLLVFWHWAKNNYDIAKATPEWRREVGADYLKKYHATKPSERADALDLLNVYDEHFFRTATLEERAAFAIAVGYSPLEFEIMEEGFSLRELMQALKTLEVNNGPAPEDMLTEFFQRFARLWLNRKQPINMPQVIAQYRREQAMKSEDRARAILKAFGVGLLDPNKPEDMQKWKRVSGARGR